MLSFFSLSINKLSVFILGVILIFVMMNVVMLSVVMLSVVMLSVVMPNVVLLNVMAPVVTLSSRECLGHLKLQFEYHSFLRLNIATCVPLQYSLFLNKVRIFEIDNFNFKISNHSLLASLDLLGLSL